MCIFRVYYYSSTVGIVSLAVSGIAARYRRFISSGSVISPNQTLTLASVPPRIGGVASGVIQVSQRVGSAVGMTIVLSGFFANYAPLGARGAAAKTLIASIAMIGVALVIAIIDWYRRRNHADVLL